MVARNCNNINTRLLDTAQLEYKIFVAEFFAVKGDISADKYRIRLLFNNCFGKCFAYLFAVLCHFAVARFDNLQKIFVVVGQLLGQIVHISCVKKCDFLFFIGFVLPAGC